MINALIMIRDILHLTVLVAHWHPEYVVLVNGLIESVTSANIAVLRNLAKETGVVGRWCVPKSSCGMQIL